MRMREFILNSKGFCFLCLDKVGGQLNQLLTQQSSTTCSLLHLSRYLKLDMTKVFYEEGQIPFKLLSTVQHSELKVELCEECANLNSRFSKVFRQLEKTELEAASYLDSIHHRLIRARAGAEGFINLLDECNSIDAKAKIADSLRKEAIGKCALKLKAVQPKIKVLKLSKEEAAIATDKTKSRFGTGNPRVKQEVILDIKLESASFDLNNPDLDMEDGNSLADDVDAESQYSSSDHSSTTAMSVEKKPNMFKRKRKTLKQSRNKPCSGDQPGKLQCRICKKKFARAATVRIHYNSSHLKLRHKCNLCNKEFALQTSVIRHKQADHFGKRFSCKYCDMTFSESCNRDRHMRVSCPVKPPSSRVRL